MRRCVSLFRIWRAVRGDLTFRVAHLGMLRMPTWRCVSFHDTKVRQFCELLSVFGSYWKLLEVIGTYWRLLVESGQT